MKRKIRYWKRLSNGKKSPEFDTVEELKEWLAQHSHPKKKSNDSTPARQDRIDTLMNQAKAKGECYISFSYKGNLYRSFLEDPDFVCSTAEKSTPHYVVWKNGTWIEISKRQFNAKRRAAVTTCRKVGDNCYNNPPEKAKEEISELPLSPEALEKFERMFRCDASKMDAFLTEHGVVIISSTKTVVAENGKTYHFNKLIPLEERVEIAEYLIDKIRGKI